MTLLLTSPYPNEQPRYWLFALALVSAIAIADNAALLNLPKSYRTPLSDVIYDEQTSWRSEPSDDNGWRRQDDDLIGRSRLKTEVLPLYDYSSDDPTLGNMFMNENELARPKTNVFRYNF